MTELTYEEIESLLEQENEALKSSDFKVLEGIADQKEQMADRLQVLADSLDAQSIERLRELALQNQRLQLATINGLRSVLQRLDASRRVALHLDTYDARGKMHDLAVPPNTLEKRA